MEESTRNNLFVDVSGLLRGETRQIDVKMEVPQDEHDFDVTFIKPPRIEGKVVNMSGYVELSATLALSYETECSRCLAPIKREFSLDIKAPVAETLENMDNDEYVFTTDGAIDMTSLVRESLILNLPISHLCHDDCKGLCIKCGADLNRGDCGCVRVEKDPRWKILESFFDED